MIVLYAVLLWIIFGNGHESLFGWVELALVLSAAAVSVVFIILSRHSFPLLRVGPDGLEFPLRPYRRIEWHEIERALYIPHRPLFWSAREWLQIELRPDSSGPFPIPFFGRLRRWFMPNATLRVPLHVLRAPSGDVLSSVERFMQVVETDLQVPESVHSDPRPS
jgi:hypothetical protein